MRNRLVRFDGGKDSFEKSERGCLRYIVKSIVAIVGLHISISVSAYTITVSYPTAGGAAVAPIHEIRTEVVNGVEWTYMTGFIYIEQDSRPKEVLYADWISMNPNGASGLMAVPGYWGVYIGDGTNAAVSASISGHVNVPSELGGMRVIGISANAFWNCTGMTGVTVPDTVLKIQEAAFGRCSGLEEMTLPFIGEERGVDEWAGWTVLGWVFGRTWDIFAGAETTYYDNRWEEREFDGGRFFTMDLAEDRPRITKWSGFCLPAGLKKLTITDETVLARKALCDQPLTEVVLPETLRSMYSGTFENMPLKQVVIPSGIKTIEDSLFSGCTSLTNVVLHSGVTKIGGSAFRNCINLKHIDIPASVTSIGGNAFNHTGLSDIPAMPGMKCIADEMFVDCWEMTKATIPEGITSIGRSAFLRCPLAEVTIPNTVTNIGHYAFDNQRLISEIEIPSSVTSIGVVAFRECTNLTHVVLAEGLESIGDNAFSGCSALTNIAIPESVSMLGINEEGDRLLGGVFRNCTSLESIVLPSTLAELPSSTFYGCKRLVDVALPSNLKSIGDWAFCDCDALVAVDIPQGVTNLGSSVFLRCDGLERVSVPDSVARIEDDTFYLCTNLVNVSLSDGPQTIGRDAFYECKKLERINIPGSVRTIGIDAFKDCSGLSQVTFNEGLEELGWGAFRGCRNVESLVLPSSLKVLGGAAFWGWKEISNVVIPSSVEVINSQAFEGCKGLKSVEIESGVRSIESNAFGGCMGLETVSISDSVTSIDETAFSGCDNLKEVHVQDIVAWCEGRNRISVPHFLYVGENAFGGISDTYAITNVSDYAFFRCRGIESVAFSSATTNIGSYAFAECRDLTRVTIPTNVVKIGDYAFSQCGKLEVVFAPFGMAETITSRNNIFAGCSEHLKIVYYEGDLPIIEELPMADIVFYGNGGEPAETHEEVLARISIGDVMPRLSWPGHAFVGWFTEPDGGEEVSAATIAFDGLTVYAHWVAPVFNIENGVLTAVELNGVKEIEIPADITSIGPSAFYSCRDLMSVTIPNSVTSIGAWAFAWCSGLTTVTIPNSVTNIARHAFEYCESLTSVTIPDSVVSIGDEVFIGCGGIRSVTIPQYVCKRQLSSIFSSYQSITNVVIAEGATSVGISVFKDCCCLMSVTIPDSVTSVSSSAFSDCYAFIYDTTTIPGVKLADGWVVGYSWWPSGDLDLTGVRGICEKAFYGCSGLASVMIPDSVTSIGERAFSSCSALSKALVPRSLEGRIPSSAFSYCASDFQLVYYDGSINDLSWVKLSFNGNGGSVNSESIDVLGGQVVGAMPTAQRAGYAFTGWFTAAEGGEQVTSETVASSDMTLYAHWRKAEGPTSFGGDADWVQELDGSWRSGNISHDGKTSAMLSVDGPGMLAFNWKTSSESDYDKLHFYVNDIETVSAISGEMSDWAFVEYEVVESGTTVVKWEYTKDGSVSSGSDCGWVKDIVWVSSGNSSAVPEFAIVDGELKVVALNGHTKISLPDGVTSIADEAFIGCYELESVAIPASVTNICSDAFAGCAGIKEVECFPDVLMPVEERKVSVNHGTDWVDQTEFDGSYWYGGGSEDVAVASLEMNMAGPVVLTFDVNAEEAYGTYYNMYDRKLSVYVDGVKTQEFDWSNWQWGWTSAQVNLGDGEHLVRLEFEYTGGYNFWVRRIRCSSTLQGKTLAQIFPDSCIETLIVSMGTKKMPGGFCEDVSSLRRVDLPSGLVEISADAFAGCYGIEDVSIPQAVLENGVSSVFKEEDMVIRNVVLRDDVTVLPGNCFAGRYYLQSVELPNGLVEIGDNAFGGCGYLENVAIPASVQRIGHMAFCYCTSLSAVSFKGDAPAVADDAFVSVNYGCVGLVPRDSSGWHVYEGMTWKGGLSLLYEDNLDPVDDGGPVVEWNIENGVLVGVDLDGAVDAVIPNGVTSIGAYAFMGYGGLVCVRIPNSVTNIGEFAFVSCCNLATVYIPASLDFNEADTFVGCAPDIEFIFTGGDSLPVVSDDPDAIVAGDVESGYTIRPSDSKTDVVVTIPDGVDASKVTVEISSAVESVKANGAMVKVVANGCDITSHLDIPAAIDGVVDMTKATVKEEVVKEAMDTSKGAEIDMTPASPTLTTAETKPGLTYTLREGTTLDGMTDGDSKVGDGTKWTPAITVKGGKSGFYTIKVEK